MRAIDADALQKEYMNEHNGKRLLLIDVAPTIEAEPKHGDRDNYCPHCGARMDGGTEGEST